MGCVGMFWFSEKGGDKQVNDQRMGGGKAERSWGGIRSGRKKESKDTDLWW